MRQYKTVDIARIIGIHVNTVRLYEKCSLIPKPDRLPNGYRVFTDLYVEQFKLARAALRVEVLQNELRKQAVNIIKASAVGDYEAAAALTCRYIRQVEQERENAEEAIQITRQMFAGLNGEESANAYYTRKEVADLLNVTIDTLRCANYSLSAILRMLQAISNDPTTNIRTVIDTPKDDDDIIKACDKLLTSLSEARKNAVYVVSQIEKMREMSK